MFPSGVDLKLKRPKGSVFGKERQHLHPVDPGVRVCIAVCAHACLWVWTKGSVLGVSSVALR